MTSIRNKDLLVIQVKDFDFWCLFDFREPVKIESTRPIIKLIEQYQNYIGDFAEDLQAVVVPEYLNVSKLEKDSVYSGILINTGSINKEEATLFQLQMVSFTKMTKHDGFYTANVFSLEKALELSTKTKNNKKEWELVKQKYVTAFNDSIDEVISYFSLYQRSYYFRILTVVIYLQDKLKGRCSHYEISKTGFCYLLAQFGDTDQLSIKPWKHDDIALIAELTARMKKFIKAEYCRSFRYYQEGLYPQIIRKNQVPQGYIPAIVVSELQIRKFFSLNYSHLNSSYIGAIEENPATSVMINQIIASSSHSGNTQIALIGAENTIIAMKGTVQLSSDGLYLTSKQRVKLLDVILVGNVLYTKTELIEEKITARELSRSRIVFAELLKHENYTIGRISPYDPDVNILTEEDYIANNSYIIMNALNIPLLPLKTTYRRLEIAKTAIDEDRKCKLKCTCAVANHQYDKALEYINLKKKLEYEDADNLLLEGKILRGIGRYEDALGIFDKLTALEHNNMYSCLEAVITLRKMKEFDQAIEYCSRSYHVDWYPMICQKAIILKEQGKLQESLDYIQKQIEKKSDYSGLLFYAGIMYRELKMDNEALEYFDKVISQKSEYYYEYHAAKAEILIKQGKLKQALEPAIKSLEMILVKQNERKKLNDEAQIDNNITKLLASDIENIGDIIDILKDDEQKYDFLKKLHPIFLKINTYKLEDMDQLTLLSETEARNLLESA